MGATATAYINSVAPTPAAQCEQRPASGRHCPLYSALAHGHRCNAKWTGESSVATLASSRWKHPRTQQATRREVGLPALR